MKKIIAIALLAVAIISCKQKQKKAELPREFRIEAITLLGDTLYTPIVKKGAPFQKFKLAQKAYENNPTNADSLIWHGRRTAYLGQYQKAIEIFTEGIQKHPNDARMYRHRGHRYISTRQYDKAIADFEKAVKLIEGTEDQIEPDGLPNERNIPLSTLHGNIWYHLGLAHYLKNDMENALHAYSNRTVTEKYPDNVVSGGHWLYMIQRRLGKDEGAIASIAKVTKDMDIIENMSYHTMCLFYKGHITEEELGAEKIGTSSSDVFRYGLANWYLYEKQDIAKAKSIYEHLLKNGNQFSFAYLAAESDYQRLFSSE